MKNIFNIMFSILFIFMIPIIGSAESSYGKIDVYFDGKLYPGAEMPKPFLKIGEPFKVRFDIIPYQRCEVSVMLTTIDEKDFKIINGSTNEMGKYTSGIVGKNETITYEWTLFPTENWAGGTVPLDFVYQFDDLNSFDIITKGEFTAAYITVSKEYYNGEPAAVSAEPITEKPAKAPGFVLPLVVGMLLLAGKYIKRT
ncbi:sarcinarray family MAST domain-containing protein [Methanomethylovorans sp.]|uniref:sarcinarray family MAST domain-containing protein n=1 Tax=Methanomethylovorans sp. TaxID=2758717 RepID=UPI000A82FF4B|nr:sarcinarray family MAST domain-containing protein [Methanomethylovorans sp.]